ncbi:hypothetical protein [Natrarchaeobius chitinivorans]|uniref:Uncharacterized protein n=1 Tax=Natrarchaeobius chitinivorans TaxID=1679083 RepID=A0A3N6MAW6_NATCH|nr:hypothetical protein [Natrarchaeobius chitinivorans]RQG90756.1 hypothetical protein EA473_20105 [Natrarchaeobius chitinivorans]
MSTNPITTSNGDEPPVVNIDRVDAITARYRKALDLDDDLVERALDLFYTAERARPPGGRGFEYAVPAAIRLACEERNTPGTPDEIAAVGGIDVHKLIQEKREIARATGTQTLPIPAEQYLERYIEELEYGCEAAAVARGSLELIQREKPNAAPSSIASASLWVPIKSSDRDDITQSEIAEHTHTDGLTIRDLSSVVLD